MFERFRVVRFPSCSSPAPVPFQNPSPESQIPAFQFDPPEARQLSVRYPPDVLTIGRKGFRTWIWERDGNDVNSSSEERYGLHWIECCAECCVCTVYCTVPGVYNAGSRPLRGLCRPAQSRQNSVQTPAQKFGADLLRNSV